MHPRKLKILATHSFRTSGKIFQDQMRRSGLEAALGDLVEIVYIDAPNLASGPIPDDVAPFFQGPYFEWWNATRDEAGVWTYTGWDRSLAQLQDAVHLHGPFDGIMGFSQGGAVASLAVGMQRAGHLLQGQPPLKFCICFAGIRLRARARDDRGQEIGGMEAYYAGMRGCPSLHVIGDRDPVKRMTNDLINSFDNPVVINHPKGHVIPALQGPDLQRFRAFLEAHAHGSAL